MADTVVIQPDTGEIGEVSSSPGALARARSSGARPATKEEIASSTKAAADRANYNPAEMWLAGQHAAARGVGESIGVPVDTGITGIASLFGDQAKQSTKDYLNHLNEAHPYVSGWMGTVGNIHGAVGAAELTGGMSRAAEGAGLAERAGAVARRVGYAGAENVVQATTHDINEGSLGKADVNGEKLLANMPKHFVVGAALGGAFEGAASAFESGSAALARKGAPLLEEQATRALGRETGAADTLAAGTKVREATRAHLGREIPRDSTELVDALVAEQGAIRKKSAERFAAETDALASRETREAGELSIQHEAGRKAIAAAEQRSLGVAKSEGEALVTSARSALEGEGLHGAMARAGRDYDATVRHYDTLRQSLSTERSTAADLATKIGEEREANAKELAKALESVKADGGQPGKLTPEQFESIIDEYVGITGRKSDPSTRWAAEQYLRKTYESELASAASGSESATSHVTRLQSLGEGLEKAHTDALEHLKKIDVSQRAVEKQAASDISKAGAVADQYVAAYQKTAARGLASAEKEAGGKLASVRKEAAGVANDFERAATKDRASLARGHKAAEKSIPKPEARTGVTPLIEGARGRQAERAAAPLVSPTGAMGSLLTAVHGHPIGAAGAMLSSFAAGRARAHGNFITARALRSISEQITATDMAIKKGAASLFATGGKTATASVMRDHASEDGEKPAKPKAASFEEVAKRVNEAQVNPLLVESRVRQSLGTAAAEAPQTYASTLAAAQRAQAFLSNILPRPQVDAHTLTPQLEHPGVSETQRYEFMDSVKTIADPLDLFRAVREGDITEQQVSAAEFVYPAVVDQMREEVKANTRNLKSPIDYERELHIGVLLGQPVSEVQDREFQTALMGAYQDKSAAGKPVGSKPRSGNSELAKNVMSASEKAEKGEP